MDALRLDPRGYRGTYKLVAGEPSLDLVNTVSWPGRPQQHDWFDPVTNVPMWAVAAGLVDSAAATALTDRLTEDASWASTQLRSARRIRSILTGVLMPYVQGHAPSADQIGALNRLLARAAARRYLDAKTLTWSLPFPTTLEHALSPAVLNAAHVLTELDTERLGTCPSCEWLFHDTTRNGRRTWCDMGDCGGRAKALRHYHRHRSTSKS
jgi:predicted RNA-binding Zn ribbon-like protein